MRQRCGPAPGAVSLPVMPRVHECSEAAARSDTDAAERSAGRSSIKTRVIVSISSDREFDRRLRVLAMQTGQIVIRVESMEDAERIVGSDCCGIILLDLDSLGRAALECAGDLMRNPLCPPVILLTGKGEQFDLRMTVFAGAILEKPTDSFRILKVLKAILEGWSGRADERSSLGGNMFNE